ncbi:MAG TPA: DinB family protein [Chitinophagaceae bacterium]|jgi:uncharacterized damage-inducible protein DinB|nr:DinB family protein [Chitinophagaceae bacterium]
MRKIIAAAAVSLFSLLNLRAQTLKDEEVRAQLIKDWERAKAYTIDYLNTVPADKYSFRVTDSIRNFAQQMLHLAQSNVNIIAPIAGEPNIISNPMLQDNKTAQSKDSVMYYVIASYNLVIDGIKKMKTTSFNEKVKLYNWEETRYVWLLKAFEHQTHHRAQTTIYIRLMGLHPPQEQLF